MIYDGFDFKGLLVVESIDRPGTAEIKNETVTQSGVDGVVHLDTRLESKVITCNVRLIAHVPGRRNQTITLDGLRRQIGGKLVRRHPCELVLHDAPDLYEMAILDGSFDLERKDNTIGATLTWLCPEPASYGASHTKSSSKGTVECLVDGDYKTTPIVRVQTDKPVTVMFDDKEFEITGTPDKIVTIDARSPAITPFGRKVYSGGYNIEYTIFSDFPVWEPGTIHEVSCDQPFEVTWEDRWL